MRIMRRQVKRTSLLILAACFVFVSFFFPVGHALAQPRANDLTCMMQTLVIQSVTTSINSFAWADEQQVQTANDGTVVEDGDPEVDGQQTDETPDEDPPEQEPQAEPDNDKKTQDTGSSLRPGTSSDTVKKLQLRLMDLQFFDADEATGYYGSVTTESVKLFQRTNELTIDGIAGTDTLALLYSNNAKKYTIKQGDSGTDVAAVQRRLKELKYFTSSATGYFGSSTLVAVKAFQKNNNLTTDGKVGLRTRDVLYSSKAKLAPVSTSTKTTDAAPEKETTTTNSATKKSVSEFLKFAQAQLGKKYVSGNEGPTSFDCSGYAYYCLKNSGISTGRLSAKGFSSVSSWTSVKKSNIKAGDLLFFGVRGSSSVGHVGIYLGNNNMIHCSSSKGKVVITSITSSYWVDNYKSAKRVF